MNTTDAVVVGGGLGGLSAALALTRSGIQTRVLEAKQNPEPDYWGFVIWPPGTRTLRWLGLLDQAKAEGCTLAAYRWYSDRGEEWASVDVERMERDGDFIGILPSRMLNVLYRAAEAAGIEITKGVTRVGLEREDPDRISVRADLPEQTLEIQTSLVVGADGPNSPLRSYLGFNSWRWRPPGQVIITGIAGGLPVNELRQAMGVGWSGGCVSLGHDKSWVYAITGLRDTERGAKSIQRYGLIDPQTRDAIEKLETIKEIRPWSIRVRPWVADGVVLIGDAAHPILPHLGLGGSLTLEDIPSLTRIIRSALADRDTSAKRLREFERQRRSRIAYARRISDLWALSMTSRLPGIRLFRDLNLWRISRKPRMMEDFLREMAAGNPSIRTRLNVWMP